MGYQVGVTPLQMAAAVSSVANGGTLVEPRVVRAFIKDGQRVEVPHKALRPHDLRAGTARRADRDHGERRRARHRRRPRRSTATRSPARPAPRTSSSTARYSKSDYNASFVGFVPSRKPALTILVVIDSPHGNGYSGGAVAGADLQAHRRSVAAPSRHRADDQRAAAGARRAHDAVADSPPVSAASGMPDVRRGRRSIAPRRADAGSARPERARSAARADPPRRDRADDRRRLRRSSRRPAAGSALVRGDVVSTLDARAPAAVATPPEAVAVTLGDLLQRVSGRAPFDAQLPDIDAADRATTTVASIAYDSRRGRAGSGLRRAARACKADGVAFARDAVARGAVAVVAETAAPAGVTVAVDPGARRAARARRAGGGLLRRPERRAACWSASPAPTARRRPRICSRRSSRRPGVPCGRIGTVGYRVGGREVDAARTTPEAPDLQRLLREMVAAGLRRLRDGGLVARARAAPRRRPALRRRHLHQPDARSPRLPRRHGGRTSRPSAGCSSCCRTARVGVVNLDDRRGARPWPPLVAAAGHLRDRRRRPTSGPAR